MYWRKQYSIGTCRICHTLVAVNNEATCRACWREFLDHGGRKGMIGLAEANRCGRQLFLANLHHASVGRRRGASRHDTTAAEVVQTTSDATGFRPVGHRQLLLFDVERDLRNGLLQGFGAPGHPRMAAFLRQFLLDHAAQHGWSKTSIKTSLRGLSIVLSLQDTPGAPIRASEVLRLQQINLTTLRLLEVCAAAGVLDDDRTPPLHDWFAAVIAELPEPMHGEVLTWFTVFTKGSKTPPRSKPRSETTVRLYARWFMPALQQWSAAGHVSLREISPEAARAVLPPSGNPRSTMGQGLRCLFRVLKAHQIVFLNPMNAISTGTHERRQPLPLVASVIRDGLNSTDPASAAAVALTAFHALRSGDLRTIRLTDIVSGRLHLRERVIPLAAPVRVRVHAWLEERDRRWPGTANPYLFVSKRTAIRAEPVGVEWITQRLGLTAQAIREDRILDELHATGGDVRRICDLFGLSVAGANRYASTLEHLDFASRAQSTQSSDPALEGGR
ncbi:hypothetical protein [Nocardia xishanensis]